MSLNDDIRNEAKRLFIKEHLTPAQIAERLGVPAGTIRTWKSRDKWESETQHCNATDETLETRAREIKPGTAPFESKNQKAMIHGLFARYLPDETRDILAQLQERSPIDILWDQIKLAYAALIRAQQIMYVRDIGDKTTTKIGFSEGKTSGETWEVQHAWDKQASFLNAQAKAQGTLGKLIMQYDELCRSDLATEEQKSRIEQIKAATVRITGDPGSAEATAAQNHAIADLINHPAPGRKLDDFMPGGTVNDPLCTADSETN